MVEIKGWDWSELTISLGVIDEDKLEETRPLDVWEEQHLLDETKRALEVEAFPGTEIDNEVVSICDEYLEAMIEECPTYWNRIWKAILEVEDDGTKLKALANLLDFAWT